MSNTGYVWECECGHTEHGEFAPDECSKCGRIGSFTRLPEELVEEQSEDEFEDE